MALRKAPDKGAAEGNGGGCGVSDCGKPVKRHLPAGRVSAALPNERVKSGGRSVALCKDHYREFKKATRADRDLERAGW